MSTPSTAREHPTTGEPKQAHASIRIYLIVAGILSAVTALDTSPRPGVAVRPAESPGAPTCDPVDRDCDARRAVGARAARSARAARFLAGSGAVTVTGGS